MLEACTFAAWVTLMPAYNNFNIVRVKSDPPCQVQASIQQGVLNLVKGQDLIQIALPSKSGWFQVVYQWGQSKASILNPLPTNVIQGSRLNKPE